MPNTIPKTETVEPALDRARLYAIGLAYVQRLAKRIWTDYNVHDPGVTILELLCYALTELSYRASFPIKDLLASEIANANAMKKQFFTAREILPNRSLTLLDYRKLLIDLKGVKNAWLTPATPTYYANLVEGKLLSTHPGTSGIKTVYVAGLYNVTLDYMDDIVKDEDKQKVMRETQRTLQAHRNLCEDFVDFSEIGTTPFLLCGEFELAPEANEDNVHAEILFHVQQYLAPSVGNYTLTEMLEKTHADGTPYTSDEIFNGPLLSCGFIDDEELKAAELRTEIRLSDIISIIMDIDGMQAIRAIVITPKGTPPENKWVVPMASGEKAMLDQTGSRLVFYKRNMPVTSTKTSVTTHLTQLNDEVKAKLETVVAYDLDIPLGVFRQLDRYTSFQNHFPVVYGLSEFGLDSAADEKRKALARQFKGYLLFFDQIMANYFAQLSHLKALFSTNPTIHRTYFYQKVSSFVDHDKIYGTGDPVAVLQGIEEADLARRNRFLDHLIARFAEQFSDLAHISHLVFNTSPEKVAAYKCEFLKVYPIISSERGLAYNYTKDDSLWYAKNNSGEVIDPGLNISGLEKRLSKLLGIHNNARRDLAPQTHSSHDDEGMYLIENILLRPAEGGDPFLPICPDPNCSDCLDVDPYSYRLHIVLPAENGRFSDMAFRRFAEEVIREETPAHILPKICWISKKDMALLEKAYRDWIFLKAGRETTERAEKLTAFIETLFKVKNIYPSQKLYGCDSEETKFILGQTALGTQDPDAV